MQAGTELSSALGEHYPAVSQPVEKLQFLPGDCALAPAAVKICTVGCVRQLELYTPRGGFMLSLL